MTSRGTPATAVIPAQAAHSNLDAGALGALFDRHGSLAYGVAVRLTGDPSRAEDVVCDAFLRLARAGDVGHDGDRARRHVVAAVAASALRLRRSVSMDRSARGLVPVLVRLEGQARSR